MGKNITVGEFCDMTTKSTTHFGLGSAFENQVSLADDNLTKGQIWAMSADEGLRIIDVARRNGTYMPSSSIVRRQRHAAILEQIRKAVQEICNK